MLLLGRLRNLLRIHNKRELSDTERAKMMNLHLSVDRCIEHMTMILQRQSSFIQWVQSVDDAQMRLILTLYYVVGMDCNEIQASMPRSLTDRKGSTVMKRIQRFKKTLPKTDDFVYISPDKLSTAEGQSDIADAVNQQRITISVSAWKEERYDE